MNIVDAGKRAVIWGPKGVMPYVIGEGSHLRIPYFQRPLLVDIRSTPKEIHTETGSKGMNILHLTYTRRVDIL